MEAAQSATKRGDTAVFKESKDKQPLQAKEGRRNNTSRPKNVPAKRGEGAVAKSPQHSRNLRWLEEQSLQDIIQISVLFALGKSLKVLVFALVAIALYVLVHGWEGFVIVGSFSQHVQLLLVRAAVAAAFLSVLYWELYRQCLHMWIDGFTLRVSRGVFFKKRTTVPVSQFLTVFIQQSPFEFLTRLYSCHIYTINNPSKDILTVPAMTRRSAFALKDYLALQVNRLGKVSKDAVDLEVEMREAVNRVTKAAAKREGKVAEKTPAEAPKQNREKKN